MNDNDPTPPEQPQHEYDPDVEEMIAAHKSDGIQLRISNTIASQALAIADKFVTHGLTKWDRIWKRIEEPFKEIIDIARIAVNALEDDKPTSGARPAGPGSEDEVH